MTENFSDEELRCRCGCGMLPKRDFMEKVQRLRNKFQRPMRVSSAARCPTYNSLVSSTGLTGPHTTGRAINILVSGFSAFELLELAYKEGFTGLGVNQRGDRLKRFIHLDDLFNAPGQPRPWIWTY